MFHPLYGALAPQGPGHRGGEAFGGLVQRGCLQVLEDLLPEPDQRGVAERQVEVGFQVRAGVAAGDRRDDLVQGQVAEVFRFGYGPGRGVVVCEEQAVDGPCLPLGRVRGPGAGDWDYRSEAEA
ncbi:hypothetical protein [Actinoallomurus oryzae]|uniref:hypothetical protein n=1 Tax=Actinoallomurus oryzae TaxID=502180 RepID=UPI0031F0815F